MKRLRQRGGREEPNVLFVCETIKKIKNKKITDNVTPHAVHQWKKNLVYILKT
jgi:hypothetical protein